MSTSIMAVTEPVATPAKEQVSAPVEEVEYVGSSLLQL